MSKDKNLPAVPAGTFNIQASKLVQETPAELANALDEEDKAYLSRRTDALPIIMLRGKEKKDDRGKIIAEAGNFFLYHRLIDDIPDVPGETGLLLTFALEKMTRIFFREDKVACRSFDAIMGQGEPGGSCGTCPLSQWVKKEDGSNVVPCNELLNLLAYDWIAGQWQMIQWKRTSLFRYRDFETIQKIARVPIYYCKIHVTSQFVPDAVYPYYTTEFRRVAILDDKERAMIKDARKKHGELFADTSANVTAEINEEDGEGLPF